MKDNVTHSVAAITVGVILTGLVHAENMRKMQLLTFIQIADGKTELSFETVQQELQLNSADDVEPFVIDGNQLTPHSGCDGPS